MSTIDWGGETVVNSVTAGDQSAPQISALSNGGWVVVWETGSPGSQTASGQVFSATGNPVGGQLTFAGTSSEQVHVSDTNDGTFYVAWLNNPQPSNNGVITVQQFNDSTAAPIANPVAYTTLFAPPPADTIGSLSMTIGPDGADLTGQHPREASPSIVYATSASSRWGYQDASTGTAGETSTASNHTWTHVDGGFTTGVIGIVATDTSTGDIEFQPGLFTSAINVSTDTGTTNGDNAHMAALPGGESVIVFQGKTAQTNGLDVFAAVYDYAFGGNVTPSSLSLVTQLDVTTTLNGNNVAVSDTGDQTTPDVVSLGNDNIFVTWVNGSQVLGEELNYGNVDGSYGLTALGSPIVINTTAIAGTSSPSVAALADGRIVVTYESTDSSGFGIREQILDLRNGVITGVGNNAAFFGSADNSNDVIVATGLNDTLNGGNGNDELAGGAGNDTFNLGSGNNTVSGGGGLDTVHLSSVLTEASFSLKTNEWVVTTGASTDNLIGISQVTDGAPHTFVLAGGGSQYATVAQAESSAQFQAGDVVIGAPVNPAVPAGTTADMIMHDGSGDYEIYDLGGNAILAAYSSYHIPVSWTPAGLGTFQAGDTSDMLLRNSSTGAFAVYDISNNNITGGAAMGQVGLEWNVAGFGDFSSHANETDMLMRDNSTGQFEIYDISNNAITSAAPMGQVGLEWAVAGFGDFSTRANETDMLMRDTSTGQFEVYDISNNQLTSAASLGQVGLEWQVAGLGDFSGNANETDLLMRDIATGQFEIYDVRNNAITSAASIGQVGTEWQVAGFGAINGAGTSDMLMRDVNSGAFEVYDITNNHLTAAASMGQLGTEWSVAGIAADPPSAPPPSQDSAGPGALLSGIGLDPAGVATSSATAQLSQAMASFVPSAGASDVSSPPAQVPAPEGSNATGFLAATNHPQAIS